MGLGFVWICVLIGVFCYLYIFVASAVTTCKLIYTVSNPFVEPEKNNIKPSQVVPVQKVAMNSDSEMVSLKHRGEVEKKDSVVKYSEAENKNAEMSVKLSLGQKSTPSQNQKPAQPQNQTEKPIDVFIDMGNMPRDSEVNLQKALEKKRSQRSDRSIPEVVNQRRMAEGMMPEKLVELKQRPKSIKSISDLDKLEKDERKKNATEPDGIEVRFPGQEGRPPIAFGAKKLVPPGPNNFIEKKDKSFSGSQDGINNLDGLGDEVESLDLNSKDLIN